MHFILSDMPTKVLAVVFGIFIAVFVATVTLIFPSSLDISLPKLLRVL